jgi:hypothetical protein
MTNYDQLKQVIQAANPEIMELKFGCEIISGKQIFQVIDVDKANNDYLLFHSELGIHNSSMVINQILGRPIRLADVLLAVDEKFGLENPYLVGFEGMIYKIAEGETELTNLKHLAQWNLKDDNLDHQSDECKEFLNDLLASRS